MSKLSPSSARYDNVSRSADVLRAAVTRSGAVARGAAVSKVPDGNHGDNLQTTLTHAAVDIVGSVAIALVVYAVLWTLL